MTSRVLTTITPKQVDEHRELLCRWLKANSIDPKAVSSDLPLTIEQTGDRIVICYHEFQLSQDGHKLIDPDNRTQAWTVRRAVDQLVPLPGVFVDQVDVTTLGGVGASYITVYRLPGGGTMIAEEHTLTDEQMRALLPATGGTARAGLLLDPPAEAADR
ncbi:hypothetical protein ACFVVU_23625 [Kitasatospora sp. NPDC057965]|uniref:hypothetical protein n=1 Tax=Kitasatospora sp. NPDC057965 TaxID=3346291 RepID=UPI0036DB05DF